MMKKVLALMMAAALLIPVACAAEFDVFADGDFEVEFEAGFESEFEDGFEEGFLSDADEAAFETWDGEEIAGFEVGAEEGYTGEWMQLFGLNMEFCLPDGWQLALTEEENVVCYAEKADPKVSLSVYVESEKEEDIFAWADRVLAEYETGSASFYDVVIKEAEKQTAVYLINAEGKLIAFRFDYDAENAISRETILEIVGSAYDVWA